MVTTLKTELLVCPRCRSGSLTIADGDASTRCAECGCTFPIRDGVIDLLPDYSAKRSLAQRAMESDTVVRIYESRLWRRSFIATRALGISFEREQEMVLAAASPQPGGTVLDLACGPGIYTRALARRVGNRTVVGLGRTGPISGRFDVIREYQTPQEGSGWTVRPRFELVSRRSPRMRYE